MKIVRQTIEVNPDEIDFLRESNAIEGVYDPVSMHQAIYAWDYLRSQDVLNNSVVLKTHKILMLHQKLQPNHKGYFRDCDVSVGGQIKLAQDKIRPAMEEWCKDVATTLKVPGKDGVNIKTDHIAYEEIHPFIDGNGRTGRMFLNWERLQVGLPILVIKEEEKFAYYDWFKGL